MSEYYCGYCDHIHKKGSKAYEPHKKHKRKIDWISEKELERMKQYRKEIYRSIIITFDLINNNSRLEAFLTLLTEKQRDRLYSHPILKHYDLLP